MAGYSCGTDSLTINNFNFSLNLYLDERFTKPKAIYHQKNNMKTNTSLQKRSAFFSFSSLAGSLTLVLIFIVFFFFEN